MTDIAITNRTIIAARAAARLAVEDEAVRDWLAEIDNSAAFASHSSHYYAYIDRQRSLTAALDFRNSRTMEIYE
jgi:hypothetical protein